MILKSELPLPLPLPQPQPIAPQTERAGQEIHGDEDKYEEKAESGRPVNPDRSDASYEEKE